VKDLRQAKGWTQDELARRMTAAGHAWRQTTVTKTESGIRPTNISELATLAAVFDMPIAALFDDSDDVQLVLDGAALWYRAAALLEEETQLMKRLDAVHAQLQSANKELDDYSRRVARRAQEGTPLPERYLTLMEANGKQIYRVFENLAGD